MTTPEIQSNLLAILQGLEVFAGVTDLIRIDDGAQVKASEDDLEANGLSVLIQPLLGSIFEQSRHKVTVAYSCTIWVRTNPKVKDGDSAKWNPYECEAAIIPAVIGWQESNLGQPPFRMADGENPEPDYSDDGNNSRLIRFVTQIVYQQ